MTSEEISASRFGGSAYRSKSSTFQKKSSTDRKNRTPFTQRSDTTTASTSRELSIQSEFTIKDAISPASFVTSSSSGSSSSASRPDSDTVQNVSLKRSSVMVQSDDLLAQLNLDDDESNRDVSVYYADSASTNSSFDFAGGRAGSGSPVRLPSSKNVSFDGSNISDPATPTKNMLRRGSKVSTTSTVKSQSIDRNSTPDRVVRSGRVNVDTSPILVTDQIREWIHPSSSSSSPSKKSKELALRGPIGRSVSVSSAQSDEATVQTSNILAKVNKNIDWKSRGNQPDLDETSVSSSRSTDDFGGARQVIHSNTNPFESNSTNPFESSRMSSSTTSSEANAAAKADQQSKKSTNPFESSTNPFDLNDAEQRTTDTNLHAAHILNSISERAMPSSKNRSLLSRGKQNSLPKLPLKSIVSDDDGDENKTTKPSWMSLPPSVLKQPDNVDAAASIVTDSPSPMATSNVHHADAASSSDAKSSTKPFAHVNMYQDPTEMIPILSMVESKRQCWFQNEMDASRREWNYYKKVLRENVQEVVRVEDMLQCSYEGFVGYAKGIDDMITDTYVNDDGEKLTDHEKIKIIQLRNETTTKTTKAKNLDSTGEDTSDKTPWLLPMMQAFTNVQREFVVQVPSLEECVFDVTKLKYEMMMKGKDLEEKGDAITWRTVEQAETNIQTAFETLMMIADACEHPSSSPRSSNSSHGGNVTGDDVVQGHHPNEILSSTGAETTNLPDRWLYESQYRRAAHLGLLTWKETRREYQTLYAEIIELNEERQSRLNEILLSFLPRRKKLLLRAYDALKQGSLALEGGKVSRNKENRAIDKAIEKNVVLAWNEQPTHIAMESLLQSHQKDTLSGSSTTRSITSTLGKDLWSSSFVKDRRLVEVKLTKEDWKAAICMITLDDTMHVFLVGTSHNNNATTVPQSQLQQEEDRVKPTMESLTKDMKNIPTPEYSIKLLDYDISIVTGDSADVEFLRRTRSNFFRKRDDQVVLRLPSKKDALKWVRTTLPCPETLAEI